MMSRKVYVITGLMASAFIAAYFANAAGLVFFGGTSDQAIVSFTNVGTTSWTVPEGVLSVEVLVVAGGGGSGGSGSTGYYGGGGGGGGVIYESSLAVTPGSAISVTVGAGGAAGGQSGDAGYVGGNGGNSSFGSLVAIGGGGGGGNSSNGRAGSAGGSGGGGALYSGLGGARTAGQGNVGGRVYGQCAAGGGGAGSPGGDGQGTVYATGFGGSGGAGLAYSISGSTVYYGGGGAARGQTSNGSATLGATPIDTDGAANTGAGGGGTHRAPGRAGGSGVVIVRYGKSKAVASSIQKGLVGHWPLDGDNFNSATNVLTDKTPYSNHGTNYGATLTSDRNGQSNGAMSFDGVNDWIDLPDNGSLDFSNRDFSISAWFNLAQYYNLATTCKQSPIIANDDWGWRVFVNPAGVLTFSYYYNSSGSNAVSATTTPALNNWYQVTAVFSKTQNKILIYVNGQLENEKTISDANIYYGGGDSPHVGAITGCGGQNNPFNGQIADVRVYSRAISADEVRMLYAANKPKLVSDSLQKGLVLDMPLTSTYTKTETAGSQIMVDKTPYSNVGQNYGGTVNADSISFDGINNYVRVANSASQNITEITVAAWVKSTKNNASLQQGIVTKANLSGSEYGWALRKGVDNKFYFSTNPGYTRNDVSTYSNVAYVDNDWHHLAGVRTAAGVNYIYIDGVRQTASRTGSTIDVTTNPQPITIATMYGDLPTYTAYHERFGGLIKNVKLYNRALSADEIKSLFEKGR